MPRILHTADWQLGHRLRQVSGDRADRARELRFRAVERVAEAAHAHAVQAVVVAGGVFDDNLVSPAVIRRAARALEAFAPIPVLLVPGRPDAAEPGCALSRLIGSGASETSEAPEAPEAPALGHVRVALEAEPVAVGGVVFHPCPVRQRTSPEDPTRALPPRPPDDRAPRVVIAHGGVGGLGGPEAVARVDVEAAVAEGYDYVALGGDHGAGQVHPRAWYAGTPEPIDFHEVDAGRVLLVDLPEAGGPPTVTPVAVAGARWHEARFRLDGDEAVGALEGWLAGLDAPRHTLVRLHLSGVLDVGARARLQGVLDRVGRELLLLAVEDEDLRTRVGPDDLARLDAPAFLVEALRDLLAHDDDAHRDAARALVELVAEVRS